MEIIDAEIIDVEAKTVKTPKSNTGAKSKSKSKYKSKVKSLKDVNPAGRIDVLAYKVAERLYQFNQHHLPTGLQWDGENGLGQLAESTIKANIKSTRIQIPEPVVSLLGVIGGYLQNVEMRNREENRGREGSG
jgi:hypothetical protein